MGFSGGSANVTKAHTHDGAVVQDGGSLAANATQFGLTNGSLLYSDGSNIQELGVGSSGYVLGTASGTTPTWEASAASIVMNVNGQMVYFDGSRTALDIGAEADVMTVSSGLPVWAAPAVGVVGNYIHAESFTLGSSASTFTCTLASPIAISGISEIVIVYTGRYNNTVLPDPLGGLEMQVRTDNSTPITNNAYSWGFLNVMDATSTTAIDVDHFLVGPTTTAGGSISSIIIHLTFNPWSESPNPPYQRIHSIWNMAGANVIGTTGGGGTYDSDEVTSFDGVLFTNSAGNNIESASTVDIYKVTNS